MRFLSKPQGGIGEASARFAKLRGRWAVRAAVETLETRTLLSTVTYNVLTNSDSVASIVTPSGAGAYNANTLRAAINSANNQSFPVIIQFKQDATHFTGGASNTITLTSGLTLGPISPAGTHTYKLVGPTAKPVTISGASLYTDFTVNPGISAEFDTLTIAHGSGVSGGAINSAGPLTLAGDTFASNTATTQGGAVYNNSGVITVSKTIFIGNSAPTGGALDIVESNTAAAPTITGSTFSSNNALSNGGAIANLGSVNATFTVSSSAFSGNNSGALGGAIYSIVPSPGTSLTLSITASTFSGDTSSDSGGAVCSGGAKSLTISKDTFASDKSSGGAGGAVASDDKTLIVSASAFSADSANKEGGAINYDNSAGTPSLSVTSSTFANCQSLNAGGGAIYNRGGTNSIFGITGSTFSHDTASGSGGAVFSDGGTGSALTLNADTFTADTSTGTDGGGLYSADVTLTVSGSTFSHDAANPFDDGGGLDTFATSLTITNSTFTSNSASVGGAVYFDSTSGTGSITGCTFAGNTALTTFSEGPFTCGAAGGAVYSNSKKLSLTNDSFNNNQADYGGAVDSQDATLAVTNNTFANNSAVFDGGDIYISHDTSPPTGAEAAPANGPSPAAGPSVGSFTEVITGSSFTGSSAENGGGIYFDYLYTGNDSNNGTSLLSLTADHFTNETASTDGGAILYFYNNSDSGNSNTGNGQFQIMQSTFSGNSAGNHGGAVYAATADAGDVLNVFDSTFGGNSAGIGGAIAAEVITAQIANDTFNGNSAATDGGGLYVVAGQTATVTDSTFSGNSAAFSDGGGIFQSNGDVILDGDIVAGNYVTGTPATFTDLAGTYDVTSNDNIIGDGAGQTGFTAGHVGGNFVGSDFAPIDPLLGPLANNGGPTQTQALKPGSLAIGNNQDWPVLDTDGNDVTLTDQRGVDRPQDQGYDIGAYQSGSTPAVVTPSVSISTPATKTLPASGTTTILIPVTLSSTATSAIVLTYSTVGGSATSANGDYAGVTNATFTLPAGSPAGTYFITISGVKRETAHGPYPKTFQVNLSAASNATVVGGSENVTVTLAYP